MIEFFLICLTVCNVFFSIFLYQKSRKIAFRLEFHKKTYSHLHKDLRSLCVSSIGIGKRVMQLEEKTRYCLESLLLNEEKLSRMMPYQHAKNLIDMNVPLSEIEKNLGLSREDVELLAMLHQKAGT